MSRIFSGMMPLGHPLHHRRYQELVARSEGLDLAALGTRDRLGGRLIQLNVNRQKVKGSPVLESAVTVDRAYDEKHRAYYDYGLPGTLT